MDVNQAQLDAMAERGRRLGVQVTIVHGAWPQVAANVPPADVVTCHHVLYAIHDLEPFTAALTSHAHGRVVVEIPQRHPQWPLNPLWARFHGIQRPDGPTAEDAFQALCALGLDPHIEVWVDQLGFGHYDSFDELVQRSARAPAQPGAIVGVDVGIRHLAALSAGRVIANPRPLDQAQRRLRRLNRQLARRHGPRALDGARRAPSAGWQQSPSQAAPQRPGVPLRDLRNSN